MNLDIFHHFIINPIGSWGLNNLIMGQWKCLFLFIIFSLSVKKLKFMGDLLEFIVDLVAGMMEPVLHEKTDKFLDFFIPLFFLILFSNLFGLIPQQFSFNGHIVVTFTWAFIVFFFGVFQGLKNPKKFIGNFIPHGAPWPFAFLITPLKIISFILSPISLGLRLFVNVLVGHVMITIAEIFGHGSLIVKIPSWLVMIGLSFMETGVGLLQTYIFIMVSINLLKNAIK
jgi:F-type H+-transporting ATPase subunit a